MATIFQIESGVFERTKSGSVAAEIWINIQGFAFPAHGWDDFAVAVLAAMTRAMSRIVSGLSTCERVSFMEGPFTVEFHGIDNGKTLIRAIDRRSSFPVGQEEFLSADVARDLLLGGKKLLEMCRLKDWIGRDELDLQAGIEDLTNTVDRYRH